VNKEHPQDFAFTNDFPQNLHTKEGVLWDAFFFAHSNPPIF
jgi:hypothetical protein